MSAPYSEDSVDPFADELKLFASEVTELQLMIYGIQDDLGQTNELLMKMAERLDEYLNDDPWLPGDPTEEPPPEEVDYDTIPF